MDAFRFEPLKKVGLSGHRGSLVQLKSIGSGGSVGRLVPMQEMGRKKPGVFDQWIVQSVKDERRNGIQNVAEGKQIDVERSLLLEQYVSCSCCRFRKPSTKSGSSCL